MDDNGTAGSRMIRLDKLRKAYPDGTVAVEELTLDVAEGEIAVLVGPSGCGKTTTMRMINRLVEPTSGRIFVAGEDVTTVDPVKLRRRMGYVIQQVGLFPHETVADNVATVPRLLGWDRGRTKTRVGELLELVGLDPDRFAKRYPRELSGGQRQRVGVARALAADPPVLLMDEPFGAVDPIARERLQQEFLRLQQQVRKTIVFVTHDIDEAIRLGDRIAVMREGGHLQQYADPATLLSAPATPFVADFVGSHRTLRRLSVTPVGTAELVQWPVVDGGSAASEAVRTMRRSGVDWAVVTGGDAGWSWLSRSACEDDPGDAPALERTVPATVVTTESTLDEALAGMLAGGVPGAVVTKDGEYAGVLTPSGVVATGHHRAADAAATAAATAAADEAAEQPVG